MLNIDVFQVLLATYNRFVIEKYWKVMENIENHIEPKYQPSIEGEKREKENKNHSEIKTNE